MYFVCFFMLLCSIRHFWLRSSCIQEKSFSIQERWILYQHSDIIFRSTTSLVSEIYSFMSCHYDVFVCFFMLLCSIRHFWLRSSCIQEKSFSIQERWILYQHSDIIFRSTTSLVSEIYSFMSCHYDVFLCFFMLLCSIRHFWLRSSCIQEISFSIQERWILSQHSDTIFRSPTSLASEIYTFVSCHYDVFCVFFHVIVLDSSFLTAFQLYTRNILLYTRKMNPFSTFWHNFQISNKPSFWDIHVCILSLRCILCVFSCYCARFVIFDCVLVVYKKNPSLYKKDESFLNILTQFSDLQQA